MRKFTFFFKSLLVAFLLLGGANSAWGATTLYEKGTTGHAWAAADLEDWIFSGNDGQEINASGYLRFYKNVKARTEYTSTHSISTTDGYIVKMNLLWNVEEANGSAAAGCYVKFGDVTLFWCGQNRDLKITIGSTETALISGGGTNLRGTDFNVEISINQTTKDVSYSISNSLYNSGNPIKGTGTSVSGVVSNVIFGWWRGGQQNTSSQIVKSLVVTEEPLIVATPTFTIGSYNYEQGGYAVTPSCATEGATLTYTIGEGAATACTSGVPFYAKGGKLNITASKAGWTSSSLAEDDKWTLNSAPSSTSPETLIPFQASSDNGDKNIEHVYKSVTITGGNSSAIAGISGNTALKMRTGNNSNTITLNVNPGYTVTKVSIAAKSNNEGATIGLTSTTVDGGDNIMAGTTTFPNSKAKDPVEYVSGTISANNNIVFTFDNSAIDGTTGKKNKQILATIKVWYKTPAENAYNKLKDAAEALRDVPNDNGAANSTLSSVITTQNAAVEAATNDAEIITAKTALQNAVMTYIAAANPTTGNQFDLTFLLTNPDLEGIVDWGDAAAQGWFTDIPRTGLGDYNNFAARTNQSKNCVERYTSNVYTTANTFGLYQKVTLPVGNYSFGAYALADNASNIVMAAGNAEGDAVTAGTLTAYTVVFTQASNSEIKMGLKISAEGTNAAHWMAIADLKLYKEAPTSVTATIGSTGYTTFASPYALNLLGMTASTGTVTAFYASDSDASSVTMTSTTATVAAGTGLLLKGSVGATITIPVAASGDAISVNKLVGCTTETPLSANANYWVLVNNGGTAEFQNLAENGATIPEGKAYLDLSAGAGVKALGIVFAGDTATGVEAPVAAEAVEDGIYYNLNGQQVTKDYKGIVIVNGKKFYNK